jgi:hypothetical protein
VLALACARKQAGAGSWQDTPRVHEGLLAARFAHAGHPRELAFTRNARRVRLRGAESRGDASMRMIPERRRRLRLPMPPAPWVDELGGVPNRIARRVRPRGAAKFSLPSASSPEPRHQRAAAMHPPPIRRVRQPRARGSAQASPNALVRRRCLRLPMTPAPWVDELGLCQTAIQG